MILLKDRAGRAVILCAVSVGTASAFGAERIVWKPVEAAVLKLDERPAKIWEVYRAEKREHLLLVQVGSRFLMLDTRAHQIYELEPSALEAKGKELRWQKGRKRSSETRLPGGKAQQAKREPGESIGRGARPAGESEKLLPSSGWVVRDAGAAKMVRVRLDAEGRTLEIQLPQQPDLRRAY
jgi:hypothetical protein